MNLETWLATATKNLAPKAVVKVREDISMHVETAVNRYQLERHSELEALELAVKDLGDAKVAARGFEKAYLTVAELDNFQKLKLHALNYVWFGICQLGFAIWFLRLNLKSSKLSWSGMIFSLTLCIYTFLDFFMAKKLSLKSYTISRIYSDKCFVSCLYSILASTIYRSRINKTRVYKT
jgi:hypothetical protein